MLSVNTSFDGGSVTVERIDGHRIWLRIPCDNASSFAQWFYFQLSGLVPGESYELFIVNAGESSYPDGWIDYDVCCTEDQDEWFRVPSSYDGSVFSFVYTARFSCVWFAYSEPYSLDRHLRLIGAANRSNQTEVMILGHSVQGRAIDCVRFGMPGPDKKVVWVIARQHPGETVAEFGAEGILMHLLRDDSEDVIALQEHTVWYMVPNMNPDGSFLGNQRTNAAGVNLNRRWHDPRPDQEPEVYCVDHAMKACGVDLFFDLHADEDIPFVFPDGAKHMPQIHPDILEKETQLLATMEACCDDFQSEYKYPDDAHTDEMRTIAVPHVIALHQCPGLVIEFPYKDHTPRPQKGGWTSLRTQRFGYQLVTAVRHYFELLE